MIVFSVAYGEFYIRNLFDRCLPSLLNRAPTYLADEPVSIAVFTLAEFVPLAQEWMNGCTALKPYREAGRCDILAFGAKDTTKFSGAVISAAILEQAIVHCLRRGESWAHAVPDLVYSVNALETCWALHKVTGKVVAIFNGRVNAVDRGGAPFATEDYLNASLEMSDFFFSHMGKSWREHCVATLGEVKGSSVGQLAVDTPVLRSVFTTAPNPFVGRFEPEDLYGFPRPQGFGHWDHAWKDTLERRHRLIVQTNLDAAMSIEPATDKDDRKFEFKHLLSKWQEAGLQEDGNPAIGRKLKFRAPGIHCFTTSPRRNTKPQGDGAALDSSYQASSSSSRS
jgi:hypothetical protein